MNAKIISYEHASNGLSIEIVPETDAERAVVHAIWNHGKIKHGRNGYVITAFNVKGTQNADTD